MVDSAHKHGIRIVMDIVMNHAGYNTVKDMETYNYGTLLPGASEFKYKLNDISEVNDHIDFKSSIRMSLKGQYAFYDSQTVSVSLRGADSATVTVNGGKSFKVKNGDTFKIGDDIEDGTIFEVEMKATNAEETLEKSFTFKKRNRDDVTHIYFDDSQYNWGQVYAYIYDESGSDVKSNAAWPGSDMESVSSDVHRALIPEGATMVIFSGSGGKTNDLTIPGDNQIFDGSGWTAYTE